MLFSIITVCYNSAKTISRTIESIINQTCQDFEFIIIDGLSEDNTLEIINQYKDSLNDKLVLISESDRGIYDAMNKGIAIAKGEIIGIVNSDDWLESDALEKVTQAIKNKDRSNPFIISGWLRFHYSNGSSQVLKNSLHRYYRKSNKLEMGLRHPATFVTKSTYDKVGMFNLHYPTSGDRDFVIRCFKQDIPVLIMNDIISNMSDGGVSNSLDIDAELAEYNQLVDRWEDSRYRKCFLVMRFKCKLIVKKYFGHLTLSSIRRIN